MKHALYKKLAPYYDQIYSRKDYEGEAQTLQELIRKHRQSTGNTLLEVACGTGRFLQYFENDFHCTGVDLSAPMLKVARKKLGKARLKQGDMRTFRLGTHFDVILCLFNSIANLATVADLRKTMKNFAGHLCSGGVLILGPWMHRGDEMAQGPRLFTYESEELKIARIDIPQQKSNKGMLDFHWLIAEKGKPIQYIPHDTHELTMFSSAQYMDSMSAAKLHPQFLTAEVTGSYPLYVATKPMN
jgi:SAM-dependent methyltransferase